MAGQNHLVWSDGFLTRVSPPVRLALVRQRVRAMQGKAGDAIETLETLHQATTVSRDAVALALLQAEIVHLDLDHARSLSVLESAVVPRLSGLHAEERIGIEKNVSDMRFYNALPDRGYHDLLDQKDVLKHSFLDCTDLFDARRAADRGKHYQALPLLWRQHRRAYLQCCWFAQRITNELLAEECRLLGNWSDAVYYAVLSETSDGVVAIGDGILAIRQSELIERVIARLFCTSNLAAHFVVACSMIARLSDAIPDSLMRSLGDWLIKRASLPARRQFGPNVVVTAWKTLATVADRLPSDVALRAVQVALSHPVWTAKVADPSAGVPERSDLIHAVARLVWALGSDDVASIAESAIVVATSNRSSFDYAEAIDLACHLAERGGPRVRTLLSSALYPDGQTPTPLVAQVAEVFGKEKVLTSEQLEAYAGHVAKQIRLQVQRLAPGAEPEEVAERIMEMSNDGPSGSTKVYVTALVGLHLLIRNRHSLSGDTMRGLVDATLAMAQDADNFFANRAALLQALCDLSDVFDQGLRDAATPVLRSLAAGDIACSSNLQTSEQADNPLNPFKLGTGRREDVEGMALIALAAVSGSAAESATGERSLTSTLVAALCDRRPAIRKAAFAATRYVANAPAEIVFGVLSGLRDPEIGASLSAWAALARQPTWQLNENQWRILLLAVRFALINGPAAVRRHAAATLSAWSTRCPSEFATQRDELLAGFGGDLCWSVRREVG